ncbi:MAG: GIY-YIG nuclease family protein [Spirochaetes bacterium]|nr:GIY-YIG nuclease family protein [Spirochaetota bacterium]
MQMFVYILECSDGSYYTGVTCNLAKRLQQHCDDTNPSSYVSSRKPFTLVFSKEYSDPVTAIEREKQIKKWCRAKKEALINSDWNKLKALSECRNITHHSNS